MQMAWRVFLVAILFLTTPVAGAVGLIIDATPREPQIGDTVTALRNGIGAENHRRLSVRDRSRP